MELLFAESLLGRVRLGSIRNKNNWNDASKRLFGNYFHSGIPGIPFRQFCYQEQNSRNIFRNVFLFLNIPNEHALKLVDYPADVAAIESLAVCGRLVYFVSAIRGPENCWWFIFL